MTILTAKQLKFCDNIVKGMTQYEAYVNAYDTKTENRDTVDVNANLLMKNTKISSRIKELRKPIEENTRLTLEEILENIKKLAEQGIADDDKRIALDSFKHYAKLCGYEADKVDLTSNGETVMMPTIEINGKKQEIKMGD
jgi:hypothetical protein